MGDKTLLAIDPGNEFSAFVIYDGERPLVFNKYPNATLLREIKVGVNFHGVSAFAIETMRPRGMPTSFEEMQTQFWAGRFWEAFYEATGGDKFGVAEMHQVFRADVKHFHCGRAASKDGNVRQAIIDRFGGKEVAIGKKATPGPLYGVSADVWSALAIAVYFYETRRQELEARDD